VELSGEIAILVLLDPSATLPFMHGSCMSGGSYRVPGSQVFAFTGGSSAPDLTTEMRTAWKNT